MICKLLGHKIGIQPGFDYAFCKRKGCPWTRTLTFNQDTSIEGVSFIQLGQINGKYEDDNFRIIIGKDGKSSNVYMNNKRVNNVEHVDIYLHAEKPTTARIWFNKVKKSQ